MATGGLYGNSGTGALIAQPGTETPGLYGKSPNGSVVAQPGSESAGLYGNGTTFGGYYFEWFVFQTSATQPAMPTGGTWNFQTDSGTAPSGWTNAPASNPTNPVWISIALVNSRSTSPLVWSTPGVLSYSGTINGSGAPTSGIGQIGELYIQTGVTPNALWFKSGSTTWTQITGSALYVDLTSSQTIAGTKTFSSTIQGNISGNAGTVTNGVYSNGTYVDPSWIASLAGSKITGNISGNAANVTGTVAIVNGGTGATTASGARTNLGLGTIATQDASSVAITGGSITGITDLAIADGGTGASTAGQARTNLGLGTAAVLDAGVANGVATLDAGGTVPLSQIPASIQGGVSYQGAWNASTNTPTLTSSVGTKGYYYVVSVAGSTNLNGVTSWNIGDWAIFNGTAWEKIDNTDAVTSVNGYTGTVVLTQPDISGTVPTSRTITAGTGLTGGGDLSANRTLAIDSTVVTLAGTQTLTNKTLTSPKINEILDTNGNEILGLSPTTSATDYLTVKNGIGVGVPLHLYADGPSANIGFHIQPKGTGLVTISDGTDFNKGIRFRSSGSAASAVTLLDAVSTAGRVVTLPDATTTLVGRDTTDTLTNKTLTSPIVNTPAITGGTINNTTVGATTPSTGKFTNASVTTATGQSAFNENDTITGWIYSGNSFFIGSQESAPTGLFIGSNGTKMYVCGSSGDDVNEYTLSTAWDITTASFVTVFSVVAQDSAPQDVFFKPDGLTMFVLGSTNDTVFQYTLTVAWDVSTASYASKSFSVTTQETVPLGLWFKSDGLVMYVVGQASDAVFQYTLGTAWDISTASYASISYNFSAQETNANQVNLSADGTKMWITGTSGDDILEYSLGTAWNVSTATYINNFYVGFQAINPSGMFIDSTAPNRVFVVDASQDAVYQYYTAANSLKLDTEKLYVDGQLSVNGNFVAGQNAYVDGALTVQGAVTASSITAGPITASNLSSSGTTSLATSTAAQTVSLGAGATISGALKTINIGTSGVSGSTTDINLGSAVSGSLGSIVANGAFTATGQTSLGGVAGAEGLRVLNTASSTRYVQIEGSVAGQPRIQATGATTSLALSGNGAQGLSFWSNSFATQQFNISHTATAVNYVQVTGGATTKGVIQSAQGSDSNISYVTQSKGTGAIDLAAGSSGVNISNGGTVTAITRTAAGFAYSLPITITVSAPTTAGGVQAQVSLTAFGSSTASVVSGGTGYTNGDVLTIVGGTPSGAATYTVTGVSGGAVTSVSALNSGAYTTAPTNPVSVTGGTGSGATLNLTYYVPNAFSITNAGSGYVEQPTVTFSGGGGSGAAAFATVGSGTTVKSLGSTLSLSTANGEQVRIAQANAPVNYVQLQGNSASSSPILSVQGTDANIGLAVSSKGSSGVRFFTNNISNLQLDVTHTASAVNYVQVTGSATGNSPSILGTGSDATVGLQLAGKGGTIDFRNNGIGTALQFRVAFTASAVNQLEITGSTTGFGAILRAVGTDTNIPLVLQPKGTGALQAQQTDSTATGGNARGANAVDWQTLRDFAVKVASGVSSFLGGGQYNQASGGQSVTVGGNNVVTSGSKAVSVGGDTNTNAAQLAFLGGGYTQTLSSNGQFGFLGGGYANTLAGFYNVIGGGYTNSGTSGSAVTTQSATMNGTTAVTLSGSNASIKVGQLITGTSINSFPNTYVAAISGTSLTLSQAASGSGTATLSFYTPHGVVVGGGNNQATGSYSFIGGGGDAGTAANRNVASGDWSVVGGGAKNTATQIYATIGGGQNNSINTSGQYGFLGGGSTNTVSGFFGSVIGGYGNVASGQYSTASGSGSSTRGIQGVFAASAGNFTVSADSQWAVYNLRRQTTDATPIVLATDTNVGSTYNQVILPNNSAYYFKGSVIANVTGGGNTKAWAIEGAIKRGANAASTAIVGTATVTSGYADAGASTWAIAVTADTTNGGLAVTFTGQASTTIRCVAKLETTEVTF